MLTLPNILTLSRILTLPLLGFLLWWPTWEVGYGLAFVLYCLMGLTAQGILRGPFVGDAHVIAGLVILVREIAVSGLREFLGGLQVSVPVSRLAKWKTTFQMVSLGALILGVATPWWTVWLGALEINVPHTVGLTTLWAAAALTLVTGWDYLRVGLKHMD
jgi:CDP-diacylglycerol--glycerol-3-phosphate 3-phosphatidyltransferase/cardiolipin synthase